MAETELPTVELREVGKVKLYDLEKGGQAIERSAVNAREILKLNRGRFTTTAPTPEDVEAWRNGEAERAAREGMPESGPAPQPLIREGAELEAPRTLHTPSGHTLIGLIADSILKMDPHHDVNKDGTPDRRKLAGLLHVNSVSKEEVERAMALLGASTVAEAQAARASASDDGAETQELAPDGEDGEDTPPEE